MRCNLNLNKKRIYSNSNLNKDTKELIILSLRDIK